MRRLKREWVWGSSLILPCVLRYMPHVELPARAPCQASAAPHPAVPSLQKLILNDPQGSAGRCASAASRRFARLGRGTATARPLERQAGRPWRREPATRRGVAGCSGRCAVAGSCLLPCAGRAPPQRGCVVQQRSGGRRSHACRVTHPLPCWVPGALLGAGAWGGLCISGASIGAPVQLCCAALGRAAAALGKYEHCGPSLASCPPRNGPLLACESGGRQAGASGPWPRSAHMSLSRSFPAWLGYCALLQVAARRLSGCRRWVRRRPGGGQCRCGAWTNRGHVGAVGPMPSIHCIMLHPYVNP
jgi:hypothetical protein